MHRRSALLGRTPPSAFTRTPTHQDIAVRDNLIADQESLLNIYRCQFNVDTQIVPGRCLVSPTQTDLADLESQAEIIGTEAEMAQLVNELRLSLGLAPLSYSIDLANVARNWSLTMRDTGQFVTTPITSSNFHRARRWAERTSPRCRAPRLPRQFKSPSTAS